MNDAKYIIVAVLTMMADSPQPSATYELIDEKVVMHDALEANARKMLAKLTQRHAYYGYASFEWSDQALVRAAIMSLCYLS